MQSPTSRSLAECRRRGWVAQVVEKWIPQARRRVDLWGIGDIIVMDGAPGSLLIQATSGSNHSSRVQKALAEPKLKLWLEAGNRFQVWSWKKVKGRWELRTQAIRLDDIP